MKIFASLIILAFVSSVSFSQGLICIQSGATATFETRFDSAVAHSQSGDIIYLPGGTFASGNAFIDKKLTIVGCGYHPDSSSATGQTVLTIMQFMPGSDTSLLIGVSVSQLVILTSNISVIRCNISNLFQVNGTSQSISNILISENIISTIWGSGAYYSNVTVTKNIIYNSAYGFNGMGEFSNNIILKPSSNGPWGLQGINNFTFRNNIFLFDTVNNVQSYVSSNIFLNNLFVVTDSVAALLNDTANSNGNVFGVSAANIFVNYQFPSYWSTSKNFHLQAVAQSIIRGTDGTDVGIYGTTNPFKEGGIPFNPHYQHVSIPNGTAANGMLNINITVKAQGN